MLSRLCKNAHDAQNLTVLAPPDTVQAQASADSASTAASSLLIDPDSHLHANITSMTTSAQMQGNMFE